MKKSSFRPLRRSRTLRRRTMRGGDWQRQPAFIGGRKRRSMRGGTRLTPYNPAMSGGGVTGGIDRNFVRLEGGVTRGGIRTGEIQDGGRKRRSMRGGWLAPYAPDNGGGVTGGFGRKVTCEAGGRKRRTMRGGLRGTGQNPYRQGGRKRRSMRGGGRWAPRGDITFQEGGRKRRPMLGGVQPYDHPPAID